MRRKDYKTLKRIFIVLAIILATGFFIGFTFLLLYLKIGDEFMVVFDHPTREQAWVLTTNLLTSFSFSSMFFLILLRIFKFIKFFKK